MKTGLRVLVALSCVVITGEASASGFYNMPTNLRQCLGYGYGPGYHAPMVLGPMWKTRLASQRIQRIPHALSPPAHSGFVEPSVLAMPHTSTGHGYGVPTGMPTATYSTPRATQPFQQPMIQQAVVGPSMDYSGYEAVPVPGAAR